MFWSKSSGIVKTMIDLVFGICSCLMVFEVVCWDFEVVLKNFVGANFCLFVHENPWTSLKICRFHMIYISNHESSFKVASGPRKWLGLCQWLSQSVPYSKIIIVIKWLSQSKRWSMADESKSIPKSSNLISQHWDSWLQVLNVSYGPIWPITGRFKKNQSMWSRATFFARYLKKW